MVMGQVSVNGLSYPIESCYGQNGSMAKSCRRVIEDRHCMNEENGRGSGVRSQHIPGEDLGVWFPLTQAFPGTRSSAVFIWRPLEVGSASFNPGSDRPEVDCQR